MVDIAIEDKWIDLPRIMAPDSSVGLALICPQAVQNLLVLLLLDNVLLVSNAVDSRRALLDFY